MLYLIAFDAMPAWSMSPYGDESMSVVPQSGVELANHAVWAVQVSSCNVNDSGRLGFQIFAQEQSLTGRCAPESMIEPEWVQRADIQSVGSGILFPVIPQPFSDACCLVLQPSSTCHFAVLIGNTEALQLQMCDPNHALVDPLSGVQTSINRGYWYRKGVVENGVLSLAVEDDQDA